VPLRSRRHYRCTYTLYLAVSYVLVWDVLNVSSESMCIGARVTLEEFALSTCVAVALHGPTAVRNTRWASTERLSALIKYAEMLLTTCPPASFLRSIRGFFTIRMFGFINSCIIIFVIVPVRCLVLSRSWHYCILFIEFFAILIDSQHCTFITIRVYLK